MQFTADTRNATAFELNALAEFVQKLASVAPEKFAEGWTVQRAPSGAMVASGSAPLTLVPGEVVNNGPDMTLRYWHHPESACVFTTVGDASKQVDPLCVELDLARYEALKEEYEGNAPATVASGAPDLPPAAGPAPEIPPAPGNTPPAVAAAPESTSPTGVPAAPTEVPAVPVSTVPEVPAVGRVDLDSAGCPWDARIHTSNKATIGDGTWRKKPGVDPALFESVKAELMGNVPAAPAATGVASTSTSSETGAGTAPALPASSAPALLTGNDVMARAMEIQMADGTKSAALFQAIQGAGITAGPMGLPGCTDQAVLAAALAAVNAVGAQ